MEDKKESKRSIGTYIGEVKSEMKKVTWPSRNDLYGATAVVIVVTMATSAATGLVDYSLGKVMEILIRLPLG